jgi:hypothetical protein
MSAPRRAAAAAVTLAALLALSALTRVPVRAHGDGAAIVRLSWRARGERIEQCRRASAEELAKAPAHMRQEVICTGARVAPYALRVAIDGRVVADGPVAGSDEPGEGTLYVLHDFPVPPGARRLTIRFERRRRAGAEPAPPHDGRRHVVPALLALDTTLAIASGTVTVVTYAPETERLLVLGAAPDEPR